VAFLGNLDTHLLSSLTNTSHPGDWES